MERTPKINRFLSAAIFAIIAEAVLCLLFITFGRISITRSEDNNFIGLIMFFFHFPGLFLGSLFHLPWTRTWVVIAAFTGAVQWFLLSLGVLMIRERSRGHDAVQPECEPTRGSRRA